MTHVFSSPPNLLPNTCRCLRYIPADLQRFPSRPSFALHLFLVPKAHPACKAVAAAAHNSTKNRPFISAGYV